MTKTPPLSRRRFLAASAGVTISLAVGRTGSAQGDPPPTTQVPAGDHDYGFPLLGDIHFDLPEHHDFDWVRREKPNDIRQIENYIRVTREHTPRLLARTARAVADSPVPMPFVVQVGDLVEGLCGSYDLQALQFRDTFDAIQAAGIGRPMLITKGNHDITGPGAREAFDQVLLPWQARQLGRDAVRSHYTVEQGEDLLVFFDAYQPDLDWLEQTLTDRPARHTFFVIHPPVIPYNYRAHWHVFARPGQADDRRRLVSLLGRRHAIVLCGHLHKHSLLVRQTPEGPITQLAINSVIRSESPQPREELAGAEAYGPQLLELNPDWHPDSLEQRRRWLTTERPHVTRFSYANVPGHAVVRVAGDRVDVDVHLGTDARPWRREALGHAAVVAG
jgi:hypothetical protein